nr:ribonuclease H-like domain-containing protein [Tanacetum cinerariifolium]
MTNGSTQLEGVDVDETFSLVVKSVFRNSGSCASSLFVFIAMASLWSQRTNTAYLLLYVDDIVLTASFETLLQDVLISMKEPHFSALKRILRYVRGLLDHGLKLLSFSTTFLVAYSDADWAEAEYCGVANAIAKTCCLRNLLRELHTPFSFATLVYYDNISAVYLYSNLVQHQRTKHIKINIHFVRDLVAADQSDKFVLSKNQMYVGMGYAVNGMFKLNAMEIGSSTRLYDEVVQDKRQQDDNDLQDESQYQPKEEEVKPRRIKRARTDKSFGPDFISFMEFMNLPPGCKPLGYKWIFKKKMKADGTIDKMKNTIVATLVNVTGAPVTNPIANHAEKPEKFNGQNFKRWQHKMFLYLTTLSLAQFLKETAPQTMTAKELWESLECKYKTKDAGIKKFAVARFLDYKMVDSKNLITQANAVEHAGSSSKSNSKAKGKGKGKNDKKRKGKVEYLAHKVR